MRRREILFYAISIVLLVIGLFFDEEISLFFASHRIASLNYIMHGFSFLGEWFVVFIIVTMLFLFKSRRKLPLAWVSLILSAIITLLLKNIIARPRPEYALAASSSFSFPSGHSTAVFSVLAFFGKIKAIWWLAFAVLVAFSRIYLGMHYLSDVAAGALIGYTIGLIILLAVNKKNKIRNKKKI